MKIILLALSFVCSLGISYGQASSPFTGCPGVTIAIARPGINAYNNDPVTFYSLNTATGVTTALGGGPLKNPANTANNIDINAVGLNKADGYLYGMNPGVTATPDFYRMGSNYSIEQIGKLLAPPPSFNGTSSVTGIVNSVAGEFDNLGNYYFTAVTGVIKMASPVANSTFVPNDFYIGKLANAAGLSAGTGTLTPTYTKVDFSAVTCSDYYTSIKAEVSQTKAQNTGLSDLTYSAADGNLYTYVSFESPAGSGVFKGQLLKVNPATGVVTCYPASVLAFISAANQTAGVLIATNGDIEVLFSDGSTYKTVASSPGVYTGAITLLNEASIPYQLRGDLAACGTTIVPILPFSGCVTIAIARTGANTYNNEAVSFYNLNTTTGTTAIIGGGPLKDPANTANNMDINGVGYNVTNGFLYGMNPAATTTPKFYKMGSNYAVEQVGVLPAPAPASPNTQGIVNSAAGEFDNAGNYYFTAVTGVVNFAVPISNSTFTPGDFYIGKLANVAGLLAGNTNLAPTYTKIDLSAATCSEYFTSIKATVSQGTAQNTGLRDITYSVNDGNLYTYVTFESPTGSGVFKGQLLKVSPLTGVVTCYPASVLSFASASNETAGVLITSTNDIEVLFTNGSIYKANTTAPGVYTGGITLINATSIPYQLRGDLASCSGTINGPLPVTFVGFSATEVDCKVNYHWGVELELNVARYELQLLNNSGAFITVAQVTATNSPLKHSYSVPVPVTGKRITARVKQIDFDSRFTFSNTVVLRTVCEKTKTCTIINNAAITNKVQVKWNNFSTSENVAVAIYNAYGAQVSKQNVVVTAFTDITAIPLNNLAAGTYFLTALSASGEKYSASFIKK